MSTGSTTLAAFEAREAHAIDTCSTCPRLCRWACPVAEAEARETSSPWSLMTLAGLVKSGKASPSALGDLPYHCSSCGACTEACLHRNDVALWLLLSRSRSLLAHAAPEPVRELVARFAVAGNPYGAPLLPALTQAISRADLGNTRPAAQGETVYLPGCSTLVESPDSVAGLFRALALHGISGVAVTDASAACCGLPLLWAGDLDGFRSHAERFASRFAGVKTVVVHDPACAHALRHRYGELGVTFEPEVVPVPEFFAERLGLLGPEESRPREVESKRPSPSVAYFDSCHLARGLGCSTAPRRLITRATGTPPIELSGGTLLEADCCGAAGLLPASAPSTAEAMAEARIAAFRASGAEELAVASPRCAAHLLRVDSSLQVLDVITLLSRLT